MEPVEAADREAATAGAVVDARLEHARAPGDDRPQGAPTAGDLGGGEFSPDQMFALRPGFERPSPYTPVEGLYLAGPSCAAAPLATCAAGAIAAEAVLADIRAGRLP